jgi:hypothetical protein
MPVDVFVARDLPERAAVLFAEPDIAPNVIHPASRFLATDFGSITYKVGQWQHAQIGRLRKQNM